MNELRFDGRVAVITGGGRGLGRAYALLLAARGARVVVNDLGGAMFGGETDRNAGPAHDVVAEIVAAGGEAIASTESVATPEGGRAIVQAGLDQWGRCDILIHSAGNVRRGTIADIAYDDFKSVVDVHLMGAFYVVQPAYRAMMREGYGRIVLTSSIGGIYGNANVVNYSVAKAGTVGLNNTLAIEGKAHGIKSNVILPGAVTRMSEGIDTSQFPNMPPELVAPVVGWLAHESCSVTGEMYVSAAGRVARAWVAESAGVFQPEWSIEDVAARIGEIRDPAEAWQLQPAEGAFGEHLGRSFAMAAAGAAA